jgi:hypothetical protein
VCKPETLLLWLLFDFCRYRWQHQASESMSRAISCPTVDAAAAAAATVIGSCMHASQHSPAAAAAKPEVSGASAQVPEASAAGGLLGSQAADTACGPVLLTLLSLLHWADNLCHATGRASESWRHGGSSSRSSGSSSSSDDVRHRDNAVLSFNVVLDERQHGTQSLLHSGLSRLQGAQLMKLKVGHQR